MRSATTDLWFPRTIGGASLLLALFYAASSLLTSPAQGDQVALGHRLVGSVGWSATAIHALFFAWLAYASLRRKGSAAFGAIAYCLYLIENIWVLRIPSDSPMVATTISMAPRAFMATAMELASQKRSPPQ